MTNWQPIETAPKDGIRILLWKFGWDYAPVAYWGSQTNENGDEFGVWLFWGGDLSLGHDCGLLGWNEDIECGLMPTHWSPLPSNNRLP